MGEHPGTSSGPLGCDAEGRLSGELPVGAAMEVQVDQGGRTSRILVELEAGDTSLPPIELAGTASLTVTIVTASGDEVTRGFVALEPPDSPGAGVYELSMFGSAAGVHFADLPAGTYRVLGMGAQSEADPPPSTLLTLRDGEARDVDLVDP